MSTYFVNGIIVLFVYAWSKCLCQLDGNFVTTPTIYGSVRGLANYIDNKRILSYLGVPYAKPPTGTRRFKRPEIPDSWSEVRDATTQGPKCPQIDELDPDDDTPMSEDCLHLNIFTPFGNPPGTTATQPAGSSLVRLLPVMVWIHGGSFYMGSGSKLNGSALAAKDIVVVSVNYRLDALGFLSTEDSTIPGNFGLLDQIQALEWIKVNIQNFGGDPDMVTIFGESAGGACVSLLVLSPLAKDLFQRAIIESGSSLAYWSIPYTANKLSPLDIAQAVAAGLNCTGRSPLELLHCLQNVDVFNLLNVSAGFRKRSNLDVLFTPRVESEFIVLPDFPLKLLLSGNFNHVDTIRGFNKDEGWYFLDTSSTQMSREGFRDSIQKLMTSFNLFDSTSIIDEFQNVYVRNLTDPSLIFDQALAAVSDLVFIAPIVLEAVLEILGSPDRKHYLYEFQYKPSASKTPPFVGAVHGEEVAFVFRLFDDHNYWATDRGHTQADLAVSDEVMSRWSSFARSGDPNANWTGDVIWESLTLNQSNCLLIDKLTTLGDPGKQSAIQVYSNMLHSLMNDNTNVVVG